ncbi:MAG: RidA family protein [Chloroflexi bacterium]|nr:RidA family protein [Chloroflexota bacterium]
MPNTENAPFSSAFRAGDFIFVSGTVGARDANGNAVEGVQAQTRQVLESIKRVLEKAGASLSDVVKVQVFLPRAEDWPKMNEVYTQYFPKDRPARTALITNLIRPEMLVEMECTAYKP